MQSGSPIKTKQGQHYGARRVSEGILETAPLLTGKSPGRSEARVGLKERGSKLKIGFYWCSCQLRRGGGLTRRAIWASWKREGDRDAAEADPELKPRNEAKRRRGRPRAPCADPRRRAPSPRTPSYFRTGRRSGSRRIGGCPGSSGRGRPPARRPLCREGVGGSGTRAHGEARLRAGEIGRAHV